MFMTRNLDVTSKTAERNSIVRIGKCKAGVTNNNWLLKLTTERHEASRGLSATAELLVTATLYDDCSTGGGNCLSCRTSV